MSDNIEGRANLASKAAVVSTLALCFAGLPAANAQEQKAAAEQAARPSNAEIVVTAQRRSERLTDVPVSVTALSAETIAASGVTDTYSLQHITQIGRASCRERVCQYVYISVVVVSLKTQQ